MQLSFDATIACVPEKEDLCSHENRYTSLFIRAAWLITAPNWRLPGSPSVGDGLELRPHGGRLPSRERGQTGSPGLCPPGASGGPRLRPGQDVYRLGPGVSRFLTKMHEQVSGAPRCLSQPHPEVDPHQGQERGGRGSRGCGSPLPAPTLR